jgi:ArsR family transcriptional regulator
MSNHRESDLERLTETFRALSNPNRLRIFLRLVSCCPPGSSCATDTDASTCAGELGKDLGIAPSTVSHHLRELRMAGLIRMERRGKNVDCGVDPQTLRELSELFTSRLFAGRMGE